MGRKHIVQYLSTIPVNILLGFISLKYIKIHCVLDVFETMACFKVYYQSGLWAHPDPDDQDGRPDGRVYHLRNMQSQHDDKYRHEDHCPV